MDTLILILRVALSLAAVLGLLWVMQRRLSKGSRVRKAGSRLSIVGRQGLGRRASIVLLEADGQRLLLGVTEHAVTVLQSAEVEDDAMVAEAPRLEAVRAQQFAEVLDATGTDGTHVATASPQEPAEPLPLRPRRSRHQAAPAGSGLAGSILSAATWRQTAAAFRQAR